MQNPNTEKAIQHLKANFQNHVEDLKTLVKIPSVSFANFPKEEVKKSAEAVAKLLKARGLENVEILTLGDAHPYVYGERLKAPGKPTLLLYAHHDVQPPGREELWKTPPFEPTLKKGPGGERLYGRGTADDKAGIVVHTAAISAFLNTVGELPVNVKVVIEGEEEIGSTHLTEFLKTYRKKLDADVLILTDTGNFDCGIPALTVALRGLVAVEIEVRALTKSVHSGMWGGPLPDPAIALCKILEGLVDLNGQIAVPGLLDQVRPLNDQEKIDAKKIPYSEKDFREQSGLIPSAKILGDPSKMNPVVQLYRLPSLTVNAIQASSRKQAGNIINDAAWAKVTVRLVPDMDPEQVAKKLSDFLYKRVPWGLELKCTFEPGSTAWSTDPTGPAFEAAESALKQGYGVAPFKLGSGGSIPFVKPFAEALGGAPALLIGVEDPHTNAHGENESMLMSDFEKACLSQIYLFSELAEKFSKK